MVFDLATIGIISAIVFGVTWALKKSKLSGAKNRYAPTIAIVIGILAGLLIGGWSGWSVVIGIVGALSAMGVWSGGKKTIVG